MRGEETNVLREGSLENKVRVRLPEVVLAVPLVARMKPYGFAARTLRSQKPSSRFAGKDAPEVLLEDRLHSLLDENVAPGDAES